jgi:hypothetical protein
LEIETRQGGRKVTRTALGVAALAAAIWVGSAAATAPRLYPHVYNARITGSNIRVANATWLLSLQRTVFGLKRNGGTAVVGSLSVAGNRVTFHDLGGPLACRGAQVNGTYTWKVTGAKLVFTRVKDTCVGRRTILARPFTRIA